MKPFHLPELSPDFPDATKQLAIKKQIDSRKTEMLENLLLNFLYYLSDEKLINSNRFWFVEEVKAFLKKVGQDVK